MFGPTISLFSKNLYKFGGAPLFWDEIVLAYLVKIPFDFLPALLEVDRWPIQLLLAMVGNILDQGVTVLALVIYVSIVQTLRSTR